MKKERWRGDGGTGWDTRELNTAGFLSVGTQQHYGRVKDEVEKKKNKKALELLLLAIKVFFPKIMKMPFHMCMHINGYE